MVDDGVWYYKRPYLPIERLDMAIMIGFRSENVGLMTTSIFCMALVNRDKSGFLNLQTWTK